MEMAQEFFSDGMTEEIAGALTKVPDLHIVARSSALEFKGRDKEVQAVGRAWRNSSYRRFGTQGR
jgi:adenylate cyclase